MAAFCAARGPLSRRGGQSGWQIGHNRGVTAPRRRHPIEVRLPPAGVFLFASEHDRRFESPWMHHRFLKALYVLRGRGSLERGGRRHRFAAGDAIVVPAGVRHRLLDRPGHPATLYGACVDAQLPAMLAGGGFEHAPAVLGLDPATAGLISGLLRQLLYEQQAQALGSRLVLVGGVLQLLGILARQAPARATGGARDLKAAVAAYTAQLDHTFFQPATLAEVAAALGMSRRRFTTLFREHTGRPWARYLEGLRIDHARRLLARRDRPVVAVAFECGFRDVSTFHRAFRRQTGVTPAADAEQRQPG